MLKNTRCYCTGTFQQRIPTFYSQEHGLAGNKVLDIVLDKNGVLWAATENGLSYFENDCFKTFDLTQNDTNLCVSTLFCDKKGRLWVGAGKRLFVIEKNNVVRVEEFDQDVVQIDEDDTSTIWLLTKNRLLAERNGEFVPVISHTESGEGLCMTAYGNERVYVGSDKALLPKAGKRCHWSPITAEFSGLLSNRVQCIKADPWGHLWIGTDEGACIYDDKDFWITCEEKTGLPYGDIRAIEFDAEGGAYFATSKGFYILKDGKSKYLGYKRWVPAFEVNAIAVNDDGSVVWAATNEGISCIESVPMTLKQKADYYQDIVEKYHVRDGFVTIRKITKDYDLTDGRVEISDNDGLWTGQYVASQSFRYAVTGEQEALELARRGLKAMIKLTKITGSPGFTARAIRRPGEVGYGDGDPEWIKATDEIGPCEWKCETSSDEMVGHFHGMAIYYDLCANDEEKKEISDALCGIVDHILKNNYRLVDIDGLPTTWAAWDPKLLNHDLKWFNEKGVNALELLTFLKVAHHISGKKSYDKTYRELITNEHYALNVTHHKIFDAHACHIDDNLGFLMSAILLRLEKDPILRNLYMMGMETHWQYERIERSPMWNFIYGAMSNRHCDVDLAVEGLEEMPLCLAKGPIYNSHRKDIVWDTEQEAFGEAPQLLHPLPFDERPINKYDNNPFRVDYENGDSVEDGTMFLHPYWYARYYGLIAECE